MNDQPITLEREARAEMLSRLTKRTAVLKTRQKKGRAYEYRQDTDKLPQLRRHPINISAKEADVVLHSVAVAVTQPGPTAAAADPDFVSPEEVGVPAAIDDYDPKEAMERELAATHRKVIDLRREGSKQHEQLVQMERELDRAKIELQALASENNVAQQRQEAQRELERSREEIETARDTLFRLELYHATLKHMLERSQKESIDHKKAMKALDEAMRVHEAEYAKQQRHLKQALHATSVEERNLQKLFDEQRDRKEELNGKLEVRRLEVIARQRRQAERERRLHEQSNLQARVDGDLTEEQEQELRVRASTTRAQSELIERRLRFATEKADAAVAIFDRIRMAAGAPRPPDVEVVPVGEKIDADGLPTNITVERPDTQTILDRFVQMQEETMRVDEQVADLNRRITYITGVRDKLRALLEPRARDVVEEQAFDRDERDRLSTAVAGHKRAYLLLTEEYTRLKQLSVVLDQSLHAIHDNCAHVIELDAQPRFIPREDVSPWANDVLRSVGATELRLESIVNAVKEYEMVLQMADPTMQDGADPRLEAEIEGLVSRNEMGIRIKPSSSRRSRGSRKGTLGLHDVRGIAQAFSNTHARIQKELAGDEDEERSLMLTFTRSRPLSRKSSAAATNRTTDSSNKDRAPLTRRPMSPAPHTAPTAADDGTFVQAPIQDLGPIVVDELPELEDRQDEGNDAEQPDERRGGGGRRRRRRSRKLSGRVGVGGAAVQGRGVDTDRGSDDGDRRIGDSYDDDDRRADGPVAVPSSVSPGRTGAPSPEERDRQKGGKKQRSQRKPADDEGGSFSSAAMQRRRRASAHHISEQMQVARVMLEERANGIIGTRSNMTPPSPRSTPRSTHSRPVQEPRQHKKSGLIHTGKAGAGKHRKSSMAAMGMIALVGPRRLPRTNELTRLMAAAVASTGGNVREDLIAEPDHEDVKLAFKVKAEADAKVVMAQREREREDDLRTKE